MFLEKPTRQNFLEHLTPLQKQVVQHESGPLLIIAGPGSGKTKTLTSRLVYLIDSNKARPEEILAITFTKKAASEIRTRLQTLLGSEAQKISVGTFHSIAHKITLSTKTVLDEDDRYTFLSWAAREADTSISELEQALTHAKANLVPVDRYSNKIIKGMRCYQALCERFSVVDLDDLLLEALLTLQMGKHPPHWHHIAVDEYQDVNLVQRDLVKALTRPHQNVVAIGDPNQAIYGFRGANVENFFAFSQDFPSAKVIQLRDQFRSTPLINQAAWELIQKNPQTQNPPLPQKTTSHRLVVLEARNETDEAIQIAHEIERLVGGISLSSYDIGRASAGIAGTYAFSDFAVLCRTSARADTLTAALQHAGIPTQRAQSWRRYEKQIRRFRAYRRLIDHGMTDLCTLFQLVSYEAPKIEQLLFTQLITSEASSYFSKQGVPKNPYSIFADWITMHDPHLLQKLHHLREQWLAKPITQRLSQIATYLALPPDLLPHLEKEIQTDKNQLILGMPHESDEVDFGIERVSILTLHGSKGLEFDVVFLAGCEANLLPGRNEDPAEIEEERRLFYVGMTRAKERLYLSWAKHTKAGECIASPFLGEISSKHFETRNPTKPTPKPQLKLF